MKKYLITLVLLLSPIICFGENTEDSPDMNIEHHVNLNEKLRFIMLELQSELNSSQHTDIQQNQLFNDNIQNLISVTEQLIQNTELMTTGAPNLKLDSKAMAIFRSMANQLHTDVLNLHQVSNEHRYQFIEIAYQKLKQTCINCHALFRNP